MINYSEARQRLILHEGLVLTPYKCTAGYLTIGVGRNLETNPLTSDELKACGDWKHGITRSAAMFLLKNDMIKTENECAKKIPFWNHLDDERQYALFDMAFNLGIDGLLKFKKMLYEMSIGNYRGAAKECLNSKYAQQTGKRAKRISKLIETAKWEI